jgi:DNA-binding transcriptional ArsR family regulator
MINRCVQFFKAISDETRQKVFELLEGKELSVGEIAEKLNLTQPNVSHHLNILKQAGCVNSRREGKNIFYSVNKKGMVGCCCDFFKHFNLKVEEE